MGIATEKYIRKPLIVKAVRVTEQNFDEMVAYCHGEVQTDERSDKRFIRVDVNNPKNPRQTKAFVGDWLLWSEKGVKIYTNKAFLASFDQLDPVSNNEGRIEEKPQVGGSEETGNLEDDTPIAPPPTPAIIPPQPEEPRLQTETDDDGKLKHEPESHIPEEAGGRSHLDVGGKRVLSQDEQKTMTSDEVRDLVRTGEVVLEQDLAA